MRDRGKWIIEEGEELIKAADEGDYVGVIDALGDAGYFSVGGFTVLGLDMETYWGNIHDSNMEKLGPDGKPVPHPTIPNKIGKPEGWVPPEAKHEKALQDELTEAVLEKAAQDLAWAAFRSLPAPDLSSLPAGRFQQVFERSQNIYRYGENFLLKELEYVPDGRA